MKYPGLNTEAEGRLAEWIFYFLLPNFCFINGLQELYNNYSNEKVLRCHSPANLSYLCDRLLTSL